MGKLIEEHPMTILRLVLLTAVLGLLVSSPKVYAANKAEPNAQQQLKINLNSANLQQLMSLKGIGKTKAQAIITLREQQGGFESIEQILQVKGIGKGLFNKIKLNIHL